MKSEMLGTNISPVEVTNISAHGFWILLEDREYFLAFDLFPWFRRATISEITQVELPHPGHLHWPGLDVDLTLDSIVDPENYPLVSRK